MKANIETMSDDGTPETFRDEYGQRWRRAIHNTDGTMAVERIDDYGGGGALRKICDYESHEAGELVYLIDGECEIYERTDGDTYGVNCADEYVVRGDAWVTNEHDAQT